MAGTLSSRFKPRLFEEVDGLSLGLFRILWGTVMLLESLWLWAQVRDLHHPDYLHFHFKGFSWVNHFPEGWMTELEVAVLILASVLIASGFAFRIATFVFCVGYTHLFLAEAGAYNNHFYLICLINFLLLFTRADAVLSVRQWIRVSRERSHSPLVPRWNYQIIQWQLVIVYVYGAIAKLNKDWMIHLEPIRFWLKENEATPPWIATFSQSDWFIRVAGYGGFFIDLLCPFFLLIPRLRFPAALVLILFHALNSQLFSIGYFPLIGITTLIIFLPSEKIRSSPSPSPESTRQLRPSRFILVAVGLYFLIQLLLPFRWHLWHPANPSWTDIDHRFAWRMMLREKVVSLHFYASDPKAQEWLDTFPPLLPKVAATAAPRVNETTFMIHQYAQALHQLLSSHGHAETGIHAFAVASLNGRPFYPMIDPNVDLARAKMPLFGVPEWIPPLPKNLSPGFDQIKPFEKVPQFAHEAITAYLKENPGPANTFLERHANDCAKHMAKNPP